MTNARDQFGADNPYAAPQAADAVEQTAGFVDDGLPLQPWRTMWTAPRQSIRRIVSRNPQYGVLGLLCLNGIGQALGRASERNAGDVMGPAGIAGTVLIGGVLGGVFGGWLSSLLIRVSGRWIGGKADRRNLLAALAWAAVPSIAGLALWIPQLAAAGTDMFTTATPRIDGSPLAAMVLLVTSVVGIVLGIWSIVLLCNTVAEVQGFRSAWAGLGNLLLAGLLVVAIVLGVMAIAFGVAALMGP
jgi:hypothetical protein